LISLKKSDHPVFYSEISTFDSFRVKLRNELNLKI
jgi:hypothetical protein